mgnify:FL=1
MQYSLYCDQVKCLEWEISISDGVVFDYITKAPTRATAKNIEGKIYWKINTSKLQKDLPCVAKTKRWFQQIINRLVSAGVLVRIVENNNTPYYKISEKWKLRNKKGGANENSQGCEQTFAGGANARSHNPSTNNPSTNNPNKKNNKKEVLFNKFWEKYPKKKDKTKAKKVFEKVTKETPLKEIMEWLDKYIEHIEVNRTDPKFIKYPASWLNAWSWEDEYETKKVATKKTKMKTPEQIEKERQEELAALAAG